MKDFQTETAVQKIQDSKFSVATVGVVVGAVHVSSAMVHIDSHASFPVLLNFVQIV